MNPQRKRWPWAVGLLAVVVSSLILASPEAGADDRGVTRWSVAPASADGGDGRSWIELSLDPGATVTEHLEVRNLGTTPATFDLTTADGYFTDTGRFNMLNPDVPSADAGTWIDIPDQVEVAARGTAVVPFRVTVPDNATAGDHAAGVAASISAVRAGDSGVSVQSRVGFRVMIRVSGDVTPAFEVIEVEPGYQPSWNPLRPGAARVEVLVRNTGRTRLAITVNATLAGRTESAPNPAGGTEHELLPGDSRTMVVQLPGVWPTLLVSGEVEVTAGSPATVKAVGQPLVTATRPISLWALPWSQLLVFVGILLLAFAGVHGRRRSRRRLADLLAEAREQGRQETGDEPGRAAPHEHPRRGA